MAVFGGTLFLSAFLFFWIQPLLGRYVLPWFGGVPAVWSACLLFFQALLLAGYAWAHWLQRFPIRRQVFAHGTLCVVALLSLPIIPSENWKSVTFANPALQIVAMLGITAGLPCLALAGTSTLIQTWFGRCEPDRSPYRLYALSNAASLAALLLAPTLFESWFARQQQATIWGGLFICYTIGICIAGLRTARSGDPARTAEISEAGDARSPLLLWLLLPFCSSVLLLAFTTQLSQEVSVVPFLWTLPLAIYLLTFILAFDHPRWYPRRLMRRSLPVVLGLIWAVMFFSRIPNGPGLMFQSIGYCVALFVCCFFCHAELYRLRPALNGLSRFYLCISVGGALGGVAVSVLAPMIFASYVELGLGLLLCAGLGAAVYLREHPARSSQPATFRMAGYLVGGLPLYFLMWLSFWHSDRLRAVTIDRNFFGVCSVRAKDIGPEQNRQRVFMHGATIHGVQFTSDTRRREAVAYFGESSGVGRTLLTLHERGSLRIGVVGLGIGTLAAYAREGDYLRCYEVNPLATQMARSEFSYLADSQAKIDVLDGDARLLMEREESQQIDVLILDAFNSGSIPVHLLTREAFEIWMKHLRPNGILVVQATNKFLDLRPVLAEAAARQGMTARFYVERIGRADSAATGRRGSDWCVLAKDGKFFVEPRMIDGHVLKIEAVNFEPWTDEKVSLLPLLK
jgi:hypothetical protein